jgi:thiol:disulfide interchange protein DsbD
MKEFTKKLTDNLEEFNPKSQDKDKEELVRRLEEAEKQAEKNEKLLKELEELSKKLEKDELFEKAFVFPAGAIKATDTIVIHGFQPDTVKSILAISIAKGNEFYQQEIPVNLFLANGKKAEAFQIRLPASATTAPAGACGAVSTDSKNETGWSVFVLGFLGGLIALITPCVFPMIPVTVSFFTKRSKTKKQGIKNGLLYGLSIFLIYVLASLPFHIAGNVQPEIFNSISTSPVLNIIFFVIFIFFSALKFVFFVTLIRI